MVAFTMAVIGELEYHLDNVVAEVYKRMLEIEIQTCTTNFRLRIAVVKNYTRSSSAGY